jgi:hypothetical protein
MERPITCNRYCKIEQHYESPQPTRVESIFNVFLFLAGPEGFKRKNFRVTSYDDRFEKINSPLYTPVILWGQSKLNQPFTSEDHEGDEGIFKKGRG